MTGTNVKNTPKSDFKIVDIHIEPKAPKVIVLEIQHMVSVSNLAHVAFLKPHEGDRSPLYNDGPLRIKSSYHFDHGDNFMLVDESLEACEPFEVTQMTENGYLEATRMTNPSPTPPPQVFLR